MTDLQTAAENATILDTNTLLHDVLAAMGDAYDILVNNASINHTTSIPQASSTTSLSTIPHPTPGSETIRSTSTANISSVDDSNIDPELEASQKVFCEFLITRKNKTDNELANIRLE